MLPLVRRVAGAYHARGHEDDLMQVAWLGLIKAIDRYDPRFGSTLRTYAIPTMYGEVRRYLRDHSWAIRVPRPLQERVLAVTKAVERFTAEEGRSPTAQQLAERLGMDLEEVLEALQAGSAYSATSLDAPAGRIEDGDRTIADTVGAEDERLTLAEEVADLRDLRRPARRARPPRAVPAVRARHDADGDRGRARVLADAGLADPAPVDRAPQRAGEQTPVQLEREPVLA